MEERRQQQAAEERADDADHDVEDDALPVVRLHDDAREPAEDAADDEPHNESHRLLRIRAREQRAAIWPGRVGTRNCYAVAVSRWRRSLGRYAKSRSGRAVRAGAGWVDAEYGSGL